MPMSIKRLNRAASASEMRARSTPKISMPVELQSSTNLQLNDMLDLHAAQKMMAARTSLETEPTSLSAVLEPELTDGSSAGSSPAVENNHLTAYFPGPAATAVKAADTDRPLIPQRVPSHSKREHERLARKRSLRGTNNAPVGSATPVSPPSPTLPNLDHRTSLEMMGVSAPEPIPKTPVPAKRRSPRLENSPFSPGLGKLNEVAEDQANLPPVEEDDEDTKYMRKRGLSKFDASSYCSFIGSCYGRPTAPFDIGMPYTDNAGWI